MTNKWTLSPFDEQEMAAGKRLSNELKLPPIIGLLLARRGIIDAEQAKRFFRPQLRDLYDPFLMKDMDKAVARLNRAVGNKEAIMVYGDYDVDGTTAVALVYKFLRLAGVSDSLLHYYIPDRGEDGYGVSKTGIDYAARRGVKLIIVLDCGIKAAEEIAYARTQGIDFIVCDHHTPDETLPEAVAVLDPKRVDNTYPFTELSGCGIGYKLMQAFARDNNIPERKLHSLLDLCAVSIASDVVSVLGENRILAYHGLKQLNTHPSPGLLGIINSCGLQPGNLEMSDIVFKIGPLINAAGRMMDGRRTVDLLLSPNLEEANQVCLAIDEYNAQRRTLDKAITTEAIEMVEQQQLAKQKLIVVHGRTWHRGVIGIVASRLVELYARPVVVLSGEGAQVSGSARSAGGFDMYHAIESTRDLLTNFGGHPYAAGLTLPEEHVADFLQRIVEHAQTHIPTERFTPEIEIDAELSLIQISRSLMLSLKKMGPFGPGNPKPVFATRRLHDAGQTRAVGRECSHLRLDLTDAANRRYPFSAIAFAQAEHTAYIKSLRPFAACYTIEENLYNGQSQLQLLVRDIKHEDLASPFA